MDLVGRGFLSFIERKALERFITSSFPARLSNRLYTLAAGAEVILDASIAFFEE